MTDQSPMVLGQRDDGAGPLALDLDALIGAHTCIAANSGGGKSGAIRRLLEVTHGRVQHLVLDAEDEFYTLRERFDYVIAGGDGGDTPATVGNAAKLARASLDHGFSMIAQINELGESAEDFIAEFLTGLMSAPRELWRPVLVVVDEAQRFAPSKGSTAASTAIKALLQRGRKRGFTGILATTRVSELDPGVRGLCRNWMLGLVGQALDRRTVADQLGFGPSSADARALQSLEPRHFWAFGPALSRLPVLFRVDDVATTPVRAGQAKVATPPPRDALKGILADLVAPESTKDIVAIDETMVALRPDLCAKCGELERDVAVLEHQVETLACDRDRYRAMSDAHWQRIKACGKALGYLHLADLDQEAADQALKVAVQAAPEPNPDPVDDGAVIVERQDEGASARAASPQSRPAAEGVTGGETPPAPKGPEPLNRTAVEIACLLKSGYSASFDDLLLACGRRPGSGDAGKARKALIDNDLAWVGGVSGHLESTQALRDNEMGLFHLPGPARLVETWADKLRGPGSDILRDIFTNGRSTKAEVALRIGKSASSGWFGKGMKDLVRSRLVTQQDGYLDLHPLLRKGRR